MTREDFTALPMALALGILWDVLHEHGDPGRLLDDIEPPKPARPPKYDSAIYRKDGITYASEYDLEGLRFWHRRAADSAESGGQWAEKDTKQAKALAYWIEWRAQNPTAAWSGERNREQVTAAPPLGKPRVYQRDERPEPPQTSSYSDADYVGDDDIPF